MKNYNEYIERYFEGQLSEDEELEFKQFLASPEGQSPEYDEARAVMGFFSVGCSVYQPEGKTDAKESPVRRSVSPSGRSVWTRALAVAASVALLVTIGLNIYTNSNVCVKFVGGQKITDKELVMNDVDNVLADLLSDGTDVDQQLNEIFGN